MLFFDIPISLPFLAFRLRLFWRALSAISKQMAKLPVYKNEKKACLTILIIRKQPLHVTVCVKYWNYLVFFKYFLSSWNFALEKSYTCTWSNNFNHDFQEFFFSRKWIFTKDKRCNINILVRLVRNLRY